MSTAVKTPNFHKGKFRLVFCNVCTMNLLLLVNTCRFYFEYSLQLTQFNRHSLAINCFMGFTQVPAPSRWLTPSGTRGIKSFSGLDVDQSMFATLTNPRSACSAQPTFPFSTCNNRRSWNLPGNFQSRDVIPPNLFSSSSWDKVFCCYVLSDNSGCTEAKFSTHGTCRVNSEITADTYNPNTRR